MLIVKSAGKEITSGWQGGSIVKLTYAQNVDDKGLPLCTTIRSIHPPTHTTSHRRSSIKTMQILLTHPCSFLPGPFSIQHATHATMPRNVTDDKLITILSRGSSSYRYNGRLLRKAHLKVETHRPAADKRMTRCMWRLLRMWKVIHRTHKNCRTWLNLTQFQQRIDLEFLSSFSVHVGLL